MQAVSSQIAFNQSDQLSADRRRAVISQEPYGNGNDARSKLSIRIESQSRGRTPYEINESEVHQREKDVVEIESVQRLPRPYKKHQRTHEEETIEKRQTDVFDREIFIHKGGSRRTDLPEQQRQAYIEEIVIDDGINHNRRPKVDIMEDRRTLHKEIVIEGDRYVPPPLPPKDHLVINGSHREHEVSTIRAARFVFSFRNQRVGFTENGIERPPAAKHRSKLEKDDIEYRILAGSYADKPIVSSTRKRASIAFSSRGVSY